MQNNYGRPNKEDEQAERKGVKKSWETEQELLIKTRRVEAKAIAVAMMGVDLAARGRKDGKEWVSHMRGGQPYLIGPLGETLNLNRDWSKRGRWTISGTVPNDAPSDLHVQNITIAVTRPARAIAIDICRRFLPLYREALVKLDEWQSEEARQAAQILSRAMKVAAAFPDAAPESRFIENHEVRVTGIRDGMPYGHVRLCGDGTADIALNAVPDGIIIGIGELLKTSAKEGRGGDE